MACRSSATGSTICTVEGMAAPRLPRGTRSKSATVTAGWKIDVRNRDRWNAIAARSGMSAAALFDLMVESIEVDGPNRPAWLPDDPTAGDGVLPIDAA